MFLISVFIYSIFKISIHLLVLCHSLILIVFAFVYYIVWLPAVAK